MDTAIPFDILIKQVNIADGTGKPMYIGDIGIFMGKINGLGPSLQASSAHQIVEGKGLVASPGFIDTHSHDDVYLLQKNNASEKLYQGVTTVVTGNCGMSVAPVSRKFASEARQVLSLIGAGHIDDETWPITNFSDYLRLLENCRPGVNVVPLVGHLAVRTAAMGLAQRIPNPKEMALMSDLLNDAMLHGAFGLSTGLVYNPGVHADLDELVTLAKIVSKSQGIYVTHLRSEADQIINAMKEALQIGRESHLPVHISHHKVMGKENWNRSGETLQLLYQAQSEGLQVSCDVYPYTAGSTILAAAIHPAHHSKGLEALAEMLRNADVRKAIKCEIQDHDKLDWENLVKVDTFEGMVINHSKNHPEYAGRSIYNIAVSESKDPYDVMFDLIIEDPLETTMIEFMMSENDVDQIIKSPLSMIGSDGIPGFGASLFHPRFTNTFPRVLRHYIREKGILSLEEGIKKMTSFPARVFGLNKRGMIALGNHADIVLFDFNTINDRGTFKEPALRPEGIKWVFVNGQIAIKDGHLTEPNAGKILSPRKHE